MNHAPASIRRRRNNARRFARWCAANDTTFLVCTTEHIEQWLDCCDVSPQSRSHYGGDMRSLFGWLQATRNRDDNPAADLATVQRPRYMPRPIPDADLAHAITQADDQMRVILHLAAYAGLRAGEIAQLDATDIDQANRLVHVRQGKGRKDRLVPLHPALANELRANPTVPRRGPVVHYGPHAYTPNSISKKVSAYMAGLGIAASCHSLRHWFASKAYQGSHDIRAVQELLGHASVATTQLYAAFDPASARAAVASVPHPTGVTLLRA